ncbi:MAG: AAA family ATPase [Candidatus Aenigmarchaeota archaeon]|nr:AAA family ATPase [Candidatus Aenigmarchaeota archaeon]
MAGLDYNIIGIIGVARSGKDTVAKYISEKYNYYHVDFSNDGLEPLLKEKNIAPTKDNKSRFAKDLRKKEGMDVIAKLLWKNIKQQDNKNIVVSGFRCIEEIDYLSSKAKKITFIKLMADEKFLLKYGSEADLLRNKGDLKNFGFDKVLNYPAIKIENNGTIDELFGKIDSTLIRIKD